MKHARPVPENLTGLAEDIEELIGRARDLYGRRPFLADHAKVVLVEARRIMHKEAGEAVKRVEMVRGWIEGARG